MPCSALVSHVSQPASSAGNGERTRTVTSSRAAIDSSSARVTPGSVCSSGVVQRTSSSHHNRLDSAPSSSRPSSSRSSSSPAPTRTASARSATSVSRSGPFQRGRARGSPAGAIATRTASDGRGRRAQAQQQQRRAALAGPRLDARKPAPRPARQRRRHRRAKARQLVRRRTELRTPTAEALPVRVERAHGAVADEPRVGGQQRPRALAVAGSSPCSDQRRTVSVLLGATIRPTLSRPSRVGARGDAADRQLRLVHVQPLPAARARRGRGAGRRAQRRARVERAGGRAVGPDRRLARARPSRARARPRRLRAGARPARRAGARRLPRPSGPRARPRWQRRARRRDHPRPHQPDLPQRRGPVQRHPAGLSRRALPLARRRGGDAAGDRGDRLVGRRHGHGDPRARPARVGRAVSSRIGRHRTW